MCLFVYTMCVFCESMSEKVEPCNSDDKENCTHSNTIKRMYHQICMDNTKILYDGDTEKTLFYAISCMWSLVNTFEIRPEPEYVKPPDGYIVWRPYEIDDAPPVRYTDPTSAKKSISMTDGNPFVKK